MKTNLSALMNLIAEEEKQYNSLTFSIRNHVYNTTIQELDERKNVIEDNKTDFNEELVEIERLSKEISLLKSILYEKNNSFKLSDGRSIQTAIVDNTNARKLKNTLESFLVYRNSKKRVTEVNNSYFEIREINFNAEDIKSKIKLLDQSIQNTDFEISKLNSQEFELTI